MFGGDLSVQGCELFEDDGFGEVAVAAVLVMVSTDRPFGQPPGRVGREPVADLVPAELPDERVGEFGFDLTGTAVDRKECFEEEPRVGRVLAGSPPRVRSASGTSAASS